MVGLSDIPCVGKALDRISDATVEAMIRGLRYLLCYNSLVNNLNSEIEKVQVQEDRVVRKADADRADGKTIEDHVTKWQKEVEDIKKRVGGLSQLRPSCNCFNVIMFPNPVTRFRLGRKATHEANNVAELTLSGEKLLANEIAHLPAAENIPIPDTTYQKFASREEAYGKLWEALVKEDGHPIIGIYGMPGVGKTRTMEQAWVDSIDKKIFNKVTRANVGAGTIDVIKLQNQLAGYLGCHLESVDNEVNRASQLKNSLINGGKTLVVLDDVWDLIPLKNIGIPIGDDSSKGCKILLTSRREDVCLRNGCKDPIKIEILTIDEAFGMFKETVGAEKINSLQNTKLAERLCKECAGLPLLIHAVANALKFVTEDSWKDALFQLENCNFEEIDGIESRVYTGIQLSFDKLNKAAKTCLLLCSLFPEDAEIEIKMLEDLATGSQLLNRGRNVRGLVDNLKSSSLLLDGKFCRTVKMHDIIRDVSRSVAARDEQYAFLFLGGDSRLPDNYSTRKLLQFVESDNFGFPAGMVCPDLHTLWLECNNQPQQLSSTFFQGIGNLKILVLRGKQNFPEQVSVQTLDKLTMLILDGCDLNKISMSIIPENLEILRISDCRLPNLVDLPKLKSLRKLEILADGEIEMVPNAISALSQTLEELHIPGGFKICDAEDKISLPISDELNKMTVLRSLDIQLEDSESYPATHIVASLHDFIIHVGDKLENTNQLGALAYEMRSVVVSNRRIEGGGQLLVERAEEVILNGVKGSRNGFSSSNRESFSTLKTLFIESCEDIEHLACVPCYEIQQSQPLTSFSKLTSLEIYSCSGLKYLFYACTAKCLGQLQKLIIHSCAKLEVVIRKESSNDGVIIKFPKLKRLVVHDVQSLTRFYGEIILTQSSSTTITDNGATSTSGSDTLFDGMVAFPALEYLRISSLKASYIWGEKNYINNSFCQLKSLLIYDCSNLEFAIPLAMLSTFQNLEELIIGNCASMTSEVESSSNECSNGELALVALRDFSLTNMSALKQTRLNSSRNLYPNLEVLYVDNCNRLRNLFLPSSAKDLVLLKELYVQRCKMMSEILGDEEQRNDELVFPELTLLRLDTLPNFKSFCFSESTEAQATTSKHRYYSAPKVSFPKLVVLKINVKTIKLEEIQLGRNDSTSEIRTLIVGCDNSVQLPSRWQLQLPNIEELNLKNCWWHGSSEEHNDGKFLIDPHGTLSFQRLKVVKVHRCGVPALFSCTVFGNLHQLQELEVTRCPLLEEVVRDENNIVGTDEKTISLFQLKSIELKHLPMLKTFSGSASYKFNMPALASINVRNCPQMQNFTCLEISTPLIPDFSSRIQKYLSIPDGDSEEDSEHAPRGSIQDMLWHIVRIRKKAVIGK